MTATFLVELDVEAADLGALEREAEDLHDAIDRGGFIVVSVKPWTHPSLGMQPQQNQTGSAPL